ncbi:MAG: PD-(D/E)XK nuclease domain-containing protein, partial [Lachnospiraceae bacterium]|nr:PD-(D/E)XK nuclease domain-containing protein [Lachnospiraceae bacterium]
IAYYYAKEQYEIIQEMPSGKGFADIMFIPKHNVDTAVYPPMVIELKWDQSADTAIRQIRDRNYPEKLKGFEKILLVGINYDKDSKKHECIIEEYQTK